MIPVKTKMPPSGVAVLTYDGLDFRVGHWWDEEKRWYLNENDEMYHSITHWKHLPAMEG